MFILPEQLSENEKLLLSLAREAQNRAYAPYSRLQVGAAALDANGKYHLGNNIENGSYGATMCAERVAIYKAVSEGAKEFQAIAISTSSEELISPCGLCLQVMTEFSRHWVIWLRNHSGTKIRKLEFAECLPNPVDLRFLKGD